MEDVIFKDHSQSTECPAKSGVSSARHAPNKGLKKETGFLKLEQLHQCNTSMEWAEGQEEHS